MENRLIELESRLAFQEHTLQELNEVVVRQQQEITQIRRELEAVHAQVRALSAQPLANRSDESIPPHY